MKRAGHEGVTPHDLRRSAVRNMVQKCGIDRDRAMKITGHKTDYMLRYYNIVALGDVQDTGVKMDSWMEKARTEAATQPRTILPQPEPTKKQRVRELHEQGQSVQGIAGVLGISVATVYLPPVGRSASRNGQTEPGIQTGEVTYFPLRFIKNLSRSFRSIRGLSPTMATGISGSAQEFVEVAISWHSAMRGGSG